MERVPGGMPINVVTPEYFELLRIPLVEGRLFDDADRAGAEPVIIVNEAAARLLFPDRSALGAQAKIVFSRDPATVVGVVQQALYHDLATRDEPYVYYPPPPSDEQGRTEQDTGLLVPGQAAWRTRR